jgi:hypothetical protein
MKRWTLMLAAGVLGMGLAYGADQKQAAGDTPDATVTLNEGSVGVGIGWVWGHGQLHYQGTDHRFKISGLSLADVGGAHIDASGDVTHLKKLSDFAGHYTAYSAGLTVGAGGSATWLKNEHGVVMKLTSSTEGLRINLSTDGVTVTLEGG